MIWHGLGVVILVEPSYQFPHKVQEASDWMPVKVGRRRHGLLVGKGGWDFVTDGRIRIVSIADNGSTEPMWANSPFHSAKAPVSSAEFGKMLTIVGDCP